ncbi:PREDICTED: tumor necrosis factor receptor superfamily member 18 isoform X3 [Ceratotherium simum simum]|uniref:Tumor necrosis factor receptor superfamily member 18 isoform X3 n=1 Tax=Ceratotherium simum simum TaxID=73337 RepID=A0ABM1CI81_CERSS|nr:PREDICTED: tumor necrosis factor receptor superfamily member 18 isoform X3 [Ceratotherium simum simum]
MQARGARVALCGLALLCELSLGQHPAGGPSCGPGRHLRGTGTDVRCCRSCAPGSFRFGFKCVDCAAGTFSGGREGHCKPWADCSQFGFPTVFPGNKTHNAICSSWPPPTEPHGPLTIILLAVATCSLVLTVAQLGLHVWQLRRQRVRPPGQWCPGAGEVGAGLSADHSPSAETQLLLEVPPPAEDACSCQFPEEERGERLSEDKGGLGDLWV